MWARVLQRNPHMRLLLVLVFAATSAVGCGEPTQLEMNVEVRDGWLSVQAREVARPCTCSAGEFAEPGTCENSSDAIGCDCEPGPAHCVEEIRIERGGTVVATETVGALFGVWGLRSDAIGEPDHTLVVRGCGGVANIELPSENWPVPSIDAVGEGPDGPESIVVTWTSDPPAASALISVSDGFVARICHSETSPATVAPVNPYADRLSVDVHALAPAIVHETELGTARVWTGHAESTTFATDQ